MPVCPAVCSVVLGALHFGEIRDLFLGGTELGVFGLRFDAFASVSALLA
jgi:hypothetical protein